MLHESSPLISLNSTLNRNRKGIRTIMVDDCRSFHLENCCLSLLYSCPYNNQILFKSCFVRETGNCRRLTCGVARPQSFNDSSENQATMKKYYIRQPALKPLGYAKQPFTAAIHTISGETLDGGEDVSRAHLKNLNSMVLFFTDRVTHFTFCTCAP